MPTVLLELMGVKATIVVAIALECLRLETDWICQVSTPVDTPEKLSLRRGGLRPSPSCKTDRRLECSAFGPLNLLGLQ